MNTHKKAAVLLAFDDNAPTHLDFVVPELEKRRIVGTFYVVPGWELFEQNRGAWERAAQSPFIQLANHTWTHRGATTAAELDEELELANKALHDIYADRPEPRLLAFGRPGGVPWIVSDEEVAQALKKHHLVMRPPFLHPATDVKTPEQITTEMLALVDDAIATNGVVQIGFHGVGGDWLNTPRECFLALLDRLEAHRDEVFVTDPVSLQQHTA